MNESICVCVCVCACIHVCGKVTKIIVERLFELNIVICFTQWNSNFKTVIPHIHISFSSLNPYFLQCWNSYKWNILHHLPPNPMLGIEWTFFREQQNLVFCSLQFSLYLPIIISKYFTQLIGHSYKTLLQDTFSVSFLCSFFTGFDSSPNSSKSI